MENKKMVQALKDTANEVGGKVYNHYSKDSKIRCKSCNEFVWKEKITDGLCDSCYFDKHYKKEAA